MCGMEYSAVHWSGMELSGMEPSEMGQSAEKSQQRQDIVIDGSTGTIPVTPHQYNLNHIC